MAQNAANMVKALRKVSTSDEISEGKTLRLGDEYLLPRHKNLAAQPKPQGREGKTHIGAWVSESYKSSLLAIKMQNPRVKLEDLYKEALNDLFAKYNVPVIRED